MSSRMLIAVLIGTIFMYVWSSVLHMSPLGMTGMDMTKIDDATVASIKTATGDKAGLYTYPNFTDAQLKDMKAAQERVVGSPSGLLIYSPAGTAGMTPTQLGLEFVLELLETLLAVWLLSKTAIGGFGGRVAFFSGVGVVAAMATSPHYLLWYHYPMNYSLAVMFMDFTRFVIAGVGVALALSWLDKRAAKAAA